MVSSSMLRRRNHLDMDVFYLESGPDVVCVKCCVD